NGDYVGLFRTEDLTAEARDLRPRVLEHLGRFRQVLEGPEPEMARGRHCEKTWECGHQGRCSAGEAEFPISVLGLRNAEFVEAAGREGWRDVRDVPETLMTTPAAHRIWKATVSAQAVLGNEAASVLGTSRPKMQYLDFETWAPAIPRWAGTRPYQQ